jgi:hypothetical protein
MLSSCRTDTANRTIDNLGTESARDSANSPDMNVLPGKTQGSWSIVISCIRDSLSSLSLCTFTSSRSTDMSLPDSSCSSAHALRCLKHSVPRYSS